MKREARKTDCCGSQGDQAMSARVIALVLLILVSWAGGMLIGAALLAPDPELSPEPLEDIFHRLNACEVLLELRYNEPRCATEEQVVELLDGCGLVLAEVIERIGGGG